jgi:hypothetical protein
MTVPDPNYDISNFTIELSDDDGDTWTSVVGDFISADVNRSCVSEGFATSPDVGTATIVTSKTSGADYTDRYGNLLRIKQGSSTIYTGILREFSREQNTNPADGGSIDDRVTLSARDAMSDLLKKNVTVTIPAAADNVTHGELVESVCDTYGFDITTIDADLVVGGPKAVKWRGTLLDFLRKMAVSCHARFFTTNLNALRFEVADPINTLSFQRGGPTGYADFNSIKMGRDVDNFASSVIVSSITGASKKAKKTSHTDTNEIEAETFISGARLTTWLAQTHLESEPPILPSEVVSRDIANLHAGLIDPSEDCLIIPPDGGDPIYVAVVGIHHSITPTDWTVTFDLVNPGLVYARYGEVDYVGGVDEEAVQTADNKNPADAPGGKGGAGSVDDDDTTGVGGGGGGGSGTAIGQYATDIGGLIMLGQIDLDVSPQTWHFSGSLQVTLTSGNSSGLFVNSVVGSAISLTATMSTPGEGSDKGTLSIESANTGMTNKYGEFFIGYSNPVTVEIEFSGTASGSGLVSVLAYAPSGGAQTLVMGGTTWTLLDTDPGTWP